tara:strand:- start:105 stop:440 length:336 start_codon:yes stop_codon:yes gene_type:complete
MIAAPSSAPTTQKKRKSAPRLKSKALREIRSEQNSTNRVIPLAPFQRLVQEIANDLGEGYRFRKEAVEALQVDAEDYIINMFNGSNLVAIKCGRETLHAHDIQTWNTINNQ